MVEEVTDIPCYQILFRVVLLTEFFLVLMCIAEFICLMIYYSEESTIVALNCFTFFLLICRIFLMFLAYLKSRFRLSTLVTKSILTLCIIFISSFKTLAIADINEDSGVRLLLASTIITNLCSLLLEVGSYGAVSLKIRYLMKVPSKKDSTVKTKENSKAHINYRQLAASVSSNEKKKLKEMEIKKILYIIKESNNIEYYDGTKSSRLITSSHNDHMEDIINEIIKEEQKTTSNIFSDPESIRSCGSLSSFKNKHITDASYSNGSPQFGGRSTGRDHNDSSKPLSSLGRIPKEELQGAYINCLPRTNIFGKKPKSGFSFMGSEVSSQTSESNIQSGFTSSAKNISTESRVTPQFTAIKTIIGNKSSMKSLPSLSPFKNTLTQKAQMVKEQKGSIASSNDTKSKGDKRNSVKLKRPHISISSIYTLNSDDENESNNMIISHVTPEGQKSQVVKSLSMINDLSSSEKPGAKITSSESIKLDLKPKQQQMYTG
ncbi:unnamed protein product [Moneuplotes crassus]|uniref:Uncharacterized protein n=1 Tax=Euplotes crassus TaxID=5936 RepID=A0AAD1U5V9_EUPCR|nr:unnamed protein product [Moneuplotes crassus]